MDNVKQGLDAARVSHQNALSEVQMPFYTQALHEAVTNCLKIAWREIDVIAAAPFGIVSTHTFQIIPEISGLRAEFHNEYDVAAVVIRLCAFEFCAHSVGCEPAGWLKTGSRCWF